MSVIDDHPLVRQGIAAIINTDAMFMVCGGTSNPKKIDETVALAKPDILILDISLGQVSGLDVLRELREKHPRLKVLIFSMHDERLYAPRAISLGAAGFLQKAEGSERLLTALRTIASGELYLSETMRSVAGREGLISSHAPVDASSLTDREREVLRMLGTGLTTREVATRLSLSMKTIEAHREHIKHKLRLNSGSELVHYAVTWVNGAKFATVG